MQVMTVPEGVLWRGVAEDLEKEYRDFKDNNRKVCRAKQCVF